MKSAYLVTILGVDEEAKEKVYSGVLYTQQPTAKTILADFFAEFKGIIHLKYSFVETIDDDTLSKLAIIAIERGLI